MNTLQATAVKKPLGKKLILGFAGVLSAAVIGSASFAAAAPNQNPTQVPKSKADCVNWQDWDYKNYGQCVSTWAKQKKQGNGYGGGSTNTVNTDIDVNVEGDNNVVSIVINYLFGQ